MSKETSSLSKNRPYGSYIVAFLSTIIRYYDYSLFGLSASILSKELMPGAENKERMMVFFAVFSLSVIVRPLGAIIFGKIGDNIGRVASIRISMVIAAFSTGAVAFIPSFISIGWFAVLALTLCRMIFLISLSGEVDAIKILIAEKIGKKRRNFGIGLVSCSSQIGVLIASYAYYFAANHPDIEWLWRMNFVIGGIFGGVVVILRKHLSESELFLHSKISAQKSNSHTVNHSLWYILSYNKLKFILSMIINGVIGASYNFLIIFLGSFLADIAKLSSVKTISFNSMILIALYGFACLFSGYLSDKISSLKQITASLFLVAAALFSMGVLATNEFALLNIHRILVFLVPFYSIPCVVKIQSIFTTQHRMRMYSLSHSLGSMILSSTIPFISLLIWSNTRSFSAVLSYFLLQIFALFCALVYVHRKDYENFFET